MSIRLSLALETGGFAVPDSGRVFVFHPRLEDDLSALPKERVLVIQPLRPAFEHFERLGFECVPEWDGEMRAGAALVFATRAKAQLRDLLAQAALATDGQVLVDGAKTDGIDSILKDLRKITAPSAPISKAHGKVFWIQGGCDLSLWRVAQSTQVDGFQTRPGVFSADGIDPASRLLVDTLPAKLGRRVMDLGAGWGFLSANVLARDTVETLHLVEADHIALNCARENISDARAKFYWADATSWQAPELCDAVVMNPPFHTGRAATPDLGRAFIESAARALTPSGQLWMVANRHLPYEDTLSQRFAKVDEVAGDNRFKVLHAERPRRNRARTRG